MKVLISIYLLLDLFIFVRPQNLYLQIDDQNYSPLVQGRLSELVTKTSPFPILRIPCGQSLPLRASNGSICLSFGNCNISNQVIPLQELKLTGSEGFIVRSQVQHGVTILATNGNFIVPNELGIKRNGGMIYGAYALLEEIGFAFLHPLSPSIPPTMMLSQHISRMQHEKQRLNVNINIMESPRWPVRIWHYHSEHPLELTNYLQGWGTDDPYNHTSWESMKSEYLLYLEWLVANRQNRIEWVIVIAEDWKNFGKSTERQKRLKEINDLSHEFSISTGGDIPICMIQQHAMYMTDGSGTMQQQQQQIRESINWLFGAGFDFISTEAGSTEFTHPTCEVMLEWMNYVTLYASTFSNKRTYIKCHISTNQVCPEFNDPRTGKPINFNYLPYFANSSLGILPHTVQLYRFDDPSSDTYGNANFMSMFNFTFFAAPMRDTIYFGETAYWVGYDINVPLFLPLYGQARLYDLRMIAFNEEKTNIKIKGQAVFHSGSEWSYWLSDVVTARAGWNPHIELSLEDSYKKLLSPLSRYLGKEKMNFETIMSKIVNIQHEILVLGSINGTLPKNTAELNGIAYIEGWDTWSDLERFVGYFGKAPNTQPNRLDMELLHYDPLVWNYYINEVSVLLNQLEISMIDVYNYLLEMNLNLIPGYIRPLINEILDSALVTSLRSSQVKNTYLSLWPLQSSRWKQSHLELARNYTDLALVVIKRRESNYRVPLDRIAGWKFGPTSYNYGYLWTVHSGYYFYRDVLKASTFTVNTVSPCFMNIISPLDVLIGEGLALNFTEDLMLLLAKLNFSNVGDCLHAPLDEPIYSWN